MTEQDLKTTLETSARVMSALASRPLLLKILTFALNRLGHGTNEAEAMREALAEYEREYP